MRRFPVVRTCLGASVLIGALTAAAPASAPLVALSRIEPGLYQLKEVGSSAPPKSLCIANAAVLIQLEHPDANCSRFVIDDTPDSATVHYTCPGSGHGRTVVKIATPRSFDLETQGIVNRAPFDIDMQGRRVGDCDPRKAALR
ncbi:DUF3617 domain-containing protein [Sphingomonas immobilis]|uniref:DUF3617 family protein n=1 Tax=Sphingomonas immobilis TaxID=3063997 RepID=A0ABT8ZYD2_9SPHN|nr:DUF3617 family protein [Sphingomonas sp. CA1-15]MDO7842576.1 hypothetical protein [Sphingomonas sp. CA1-15]